MRREWQKLNRSYKSRWTYTTYSLLRADSLEVELRYELYLARGAGCVSKNLTKRASGQDQVCVRHQERWCVGYVLRFNADFQVSRFIKPEVLAYRHIQIEERWASKEIPPDVARFSSRRSKELRTLFRREENVLTVLDCRMS